MTASTKKFQTRANLIIKLAKEQKYPNAQTLAPLLNCSAATIHRVLAHLQNKIGAPLYYDDSRRGYYLKDLNYNLPNQLPLERDELAALLIVRSLIDMVDAQDLVETIDNIWQQCAANINGMGKDLEQLAKRFSSDLTVVGELSDQEVLKYVNAAHSGESIRLTYQSPWRHDAPKVYEGRIQRVHFSDGHLYLNFETIEGKIKTFNCSSIKNFEILKYDLTFQAVADTGGENFLSGFGMWSGENTVEVEVEITAPASAYYASQRWHPTQIDKWDGDLLIRRFQAILSPELVRRILSLGKFVRDVRPGELREMVIHQAGELCKGLEGRR